MSGLSSVGVLGVEGVGKTSLLRLMFPEHSRGMGGAPTIGFRVMHVPGMQVFDFSGSQAFHFIAQSQLRLMRTLLLVYDADEPTETLQYLRSLQVDPGDSGQRRIMVSLGETTRFGAEEVLFAREFAVHDTFSVLRRDPACGVEQLQRALRPQPRLGTIDDDDDEGEEGGGDPGRLRLKRWFPWGCCPLLST